ncbi:CDF family Co(II)/Ni(II) efflux transporter DmeF [Cyanobacterium aponinum UTEX 3221]|uniref:CDF family Co(II)/Ni(II) efflux transporter DmeF n=1 Tax=Cyanobacterium aponinum TaxID=379064 RepID=UPI002B4BF093|nr:CDF family Co(II)/Ni(II) efflux transporter DmeF [Cyanobacterium aponinum]WRL37986.1 CDF family Co(II)/Ni(II) efflux transporter DmeF [Cyanobacterium aponinum UTEX 3221]
MHKETLEKWQHPHYFILDNQKGEKKTQIVMALTAITMIVEIITGMLSGSMALLADGWHMATHVGAFAITLFTYQYARKNLHNPKYTFGTGKVGVLGGFANAVALGVIALVMILESGMRLLNPDTILFNEAIAVAILGLIVNLISAFLLQDDHDHHHDHDHDHHNHHDHNLQAAYLHVLADALTSVMAIIALFTGKYLDWVWMDALMGVVGAGVIAKWAYGLIKDTGLILLDGTADKKTRLAIIDAIEADSDNQVADIHIWYLSQNDLSAMISVVTHHPQPPEYYKQLLRHIPNLTHILIEVNRCDGEPCFSEKLNYVTH